MPDGNCKSLPWVAVCNIRHIHTHIQICSSWILTPPSGSHQESRSWIRLFRWMDEGQKILKVTFFPPIFPRNMAIFPLHFILNVLGREFFFGLSTVLLSRPNSQLSIFFGHPQVEISTIRNWLNDHFVIGTLFCNFRCNECSVFFLVCWFSDSSLQWCGVCRDIWV